MDSYIRHATFREPKPSDRKLDFATYHDIVMAVARSLGIGLNTEPAIPVLRFMELDDDLLPYDETAEADDETGNMPYIDKRATVLYYDPADQFWKRDDTQQKVVVCNPYAHSFYSKACRFVFLYLAHAAKWVPVSPQRPRMFVKLVDELDCRGGGHFALAHIIEFTFSSDTTGAWADTTREVRVWSGPRSQIGVALANMTLEVEWFEEPGWVVVAGGKARKITCEAISSFNQTDKIVPARVIAWDDPNENPDPDGAGLILQNDLGFYGIAQKMLYAEYLPWADKYRIYQMYQKGP